MIEDFGGVSVVVVSAVPLTTQPVSGLTPTSAGSVPSMKELLRGLCEGFSESLDAIDRSLAPSQVEVKLGLTCSETIGAWIVGLEGKQSIEVTLRWAKGGGK
jgi:hypothetical protein